MVFLKSTNDPRQAASGRDLLYWLFAQILADEEDLDITSEDLALSPPLDVDNDIARYQVAEGYPEPTDLTIDPRLRSNIPEPPKTNRQHPR